MPGEPEAVEEARTALREARVAAGVAAYRHFFLERSAVARADYAAAMEAEVDAELLLLTLLARNG